MFQIIKFKRNYKIITGNIIAVLIMTVFSPIKESRNFFKSLGLTIMNNYAVLRDSWWFSLTEFNHLISQKFSSLQKRPFLSHDFAEGYLRLKKEEAERPWRKQEWLARGLQRLHLNHNISLILAFLKPILYAPFRFVQYCRYGYTFPNYLHQCITLNDDTIVFCVLTQDIWLYWLVILFRLILHLF